MQQRIVGLWAKVFMQNPPLRVLEAAQGIDATGALSHPQRKETVHYLQGLLLESINLQRTRLHKSSTSQ